MPDRPTHDNISPLDTRYYDPEVAEHLSERAFVRAKLRVESALVETLRDLGLCPESACEEITNVCEDGDITPEEVDREERDVTKHDVRALVNCIQRRVSDDAKRFVHLSATSYDIVDTANAIRYRNAMDHVVLPRLEQFLRNLMNFARMEAHTVQVGRTHGQHASPITFGFTLASYVNRLGGCVLELRERTAQLVGKFSGAVGAYNASSLLVKDPVAFEESVLRKVGLKPAEHSTQIAPPEPLQRLLLECVTTSGVLAQIARDMRNLQRSEIAEVGEAFGKDQVGSSTMPHKRNPISFENVESMWMNLVGRVTTIFQNQISEHQRDLTNSASGRAFVEIVAYLAYMTKRLNGVMTNLAVDKEQMRKHLHASPILAEAFYILLAREGHPDAHEAIRQLSQGFKDPKTRLGDTLVLHALEHHEIGPLVKTLSHEEFKLLSNPELYTGLAAQRTIAVVDAWTHRLDPPPNDSIM